ncbi:hypothetical protein BCV71DRAFT_129648 [Rhizopus microsporus]|uniref:Uncharacterized protein n=1 Tax=Rhizopus microsporus TaxID=58291 RepID=A0A1X0RZX0_RHIZD|nr:hypothetical protein BCV71DRAFT_129648 [Rhizopus microsporus]
MTEKFLLLNVAAKHSLVYIFVIVLSTSNQDLSLKTTPKARQTGLLFVLANYCLFFFFFSKKRLF